jgi:hypothetical protein
MLCGHIGLKAVFMFIKPYVSHNIYCATHPPLYKTALFGCESPLPYRLFLFDH